MLVLKYVRLLVCECLCVCELNFWNIIITGDDNVCLAVWLFIYLFVSPYVLMRACRAFCQKCELFFYFNIYICI